MIIGLFSGDAHVLIQLVFFYRFTPLSAIASLSRVLTGLLRTFYLLVTDNQWRTTCHPQCKRFAEVHSRSSRSCLTSYLQFAR